MSHNRVLQLGLHQHYKGMRYDVQGTVRHSESLEPMVLYKALYGEHGLWVRPLEMFLSDVVVEGKTLRRFMPLSST